MIDFIGELVGLILCILIPIYFVKKKRDHKDFYLVMITATFMGIICLLLVIWDTEDYIATKNKNFETASGQCDVTEFETASKVATHELHVQINGDLVVIGEFDDFSDVEQGTYQCTVKYIKKSRTLYDIQSQPINK